MRHFRCCEKTSQGSYVLALATYSTRSTHKNSIVGALEMIRKDDFPFDQYEMIKLAQSSTCTLNDMPMHCLQLRSACDALALQQNDELEATQQMFGADFIELAQLFLEDSPKRLALLQEASVGKDALALAKFSHVLCGSSASIGASTLAALCRELEIRAKNKKLGDVSAHFHAIACEYVRIDTKLHGMLKAASHAASPDKHETDDDHQAARKSTYSSF